MYEMGEPRAQLAQNRGEGSNSLPYFYLGFPNKFSKIFYLGFPNKMGFPDLGWDFARARRRRAKKNEILSARRSKKVAVLTVLLFTL